MDLTTSARVKSLLRDEIAATLDTLIAQLITAVSLQVETHLQRHAQKTARTEDYSIDLGQRYLMLKGFPVEQSPAPVFKNDFAREFGSATTIDAENYFVNFTRGTVHFDFITLSAGPGVMRATYTGGMASSTAALITAFPDVAYSVELQCAFIVQRRDQLGLSGFSAEGGTIAVQAPIELMSGVKQLLAPHVGRRGVT